jgi:hypothetical protein
MQKKNDKKIISGFTLVEAMVAAGILGGLAIVSLKIQEIGQKSGKKSYQDLEIIQTTSDIGRIITASEQCDSMINALGLSNAVTSGQVQNITDVQNPAKVLYSIGQEVSNSSQLTISNMQVTLDPASSVRGEFIVTFQRPSNNLGPSQIVRRIPMKISRDSLGAVTGCYAEREMAMDSVCQMLGGTFNDITRNCASISIDALLNGNIIFGQDAFNLTATGQRNIAIGRNAGRTITSGSSNIAIGEEVLNEGAVTGSGNIGLGTRALQGVTTGSQNIGIGFMAVSLVGQGNQNTGVGVHALTSLGNDSSSPMSNSAFGSLSGGNVRSGASNTFIGSHSGNRIVTGSNNIALGYQALSNADNSVAGTESASDNIAIGQLTGFNITSGTDNVMIGRFAGDGLTSGRNNLLFGVQAGRGIRTGTHNIAMGFNSMNGSANTSGVGNIALGVNSLNNVTSGNDNISIGTNTLLSLTSGSRNQAIGEAALSALSTGNRNIGIGISSGTRISTGSNNIAIGDSAFSSVAALATGADNIAIGGNTLNSLTLGADNLAIGANALDALTTGARNIAIGKNSATALTAGENNNTVLGYNAMSASVSGSNNTLIGSGAAQSNAALGDGNTIIGQGAALLGGGGDNNVFLGRSVAPLNTGSGNVFIGNQAAASTALFPSATSNTLVIGNAATGPGSRLIMGNFSTNQVAIPGPIAPYNENFIVNGSSRLMGRVSINHALGYSASLSITQGANNDALVINGNAKVYGDLFVQGTTSRAGPGPWLLSDRRKKTDIKDLNVGLEEVLKIPTKTFFYKTDLKTNVAGVIAQDVQKVMPRAVRTDAEGILTIDTGYLFYALWGAVQDQNKEVVKRESENEQLKNELESLNERVARLEALLKK